MAAQGAPRADRAVLEIEGGVPEGLNASEKMELAWSKATITGISTLIGGWNLYWIQQAGLANRPDKVFVIYNFWLYGVFGVLSNAGAYSYGNSRAWLPLVSFFAMLHLEYLIFMVVYESHRLAGTGWDILAPIFACSATLVALIWSLSVSSEWWARRIVPHHQQHQE